MFMIISYVGNMFFDFLFFFFFQAEDGIRDDLVTGVQTCALPISHHFHGAGGMEMMSKTDFQGQPLAHPVRSEERRVGKSVDLGGRRIIKKKKKKTHEEIRE